MKTEKFLYDRLRNDRVLGNGKSDNNKNNNKKNNVGSAWGPVSGSKKCIYLPASTIIVRLSPTACVVKLNDDDADDGDNDGVFFCLISY